MADDSSVIEVLADLDLSSGAEQGSAANEAAKAKSKVKARKEKNVKKEAKVPYYVERAARRERYKFGIEGSVNNWEALPEDLLRIIAKKSAPLAVAACRLTCRRWNYYVTHAAEGMQPKNPEFVHRIAAEFPNLCRLDLTEIKGFRTRMTDKLTASKAPLTKLLLGAGLCTPHKYSNCSVSNEALKQIAGIPSLQCLSLSWLPAISDTGMSEVFKAGQLTSLHLIGCRHVTLKCFIHLSCLTKLQSLTVHKCNKIKLNDLDGFRLPATLRRVHLGYSLDRDDFWDMLAPATALETLELPAMEVRPIQLRLPTQWPKLRALACRVDCDEHNPWESFDCTRLTSLSLRGTCDTSTIRDSSTPLTNLACLQLTPEDHRFVDEISVFTGLTALAVNCKNVRGSTDWSEISRLNGLKSVEITETKIPLALLEALAGLSKLERLSLSCPDDSERLSSEGALVFSLGPLLLFQQFHKLRSLRLCKSTLTYSQASELITKLLDKDARIRKPDAPPAFEELILEGGLIDSEAIGHLQEMFTGVIISTAQMHKLEGSVQVWNFDVEAV